MASNFGVLMLLIFIKNNENTHYKIDVFLWKLGPSGYENVGPKNKRQSKMGLVGWKLGPQGITCKLNGLSSGWPA